MLYTEFMLLYLNESGWGMCYKTKRNVRRPGRIPWEVRSQMCEVKESR